MHFKALFVIALLTGQVFAAAPSLEIKLKHNSAEEAQTKKQLERLAEAYPLAPWYFTRLIEIDETAIPHSRPLLTLHTRHLRDDDLLLSTFVHEQIHWFLDAHDKETKAAENDLRSLFPTIPIGFPDGAEDEVSDYLHLLVNFLEWRSDKQLMGELRARQVMEFWTHDHYRVIYQLVLDHSKEIEQIISKHHLALLPSGEIAAGRVAP